MFIALYPTPLNVTALVIAAILGKKVKVKFIKLTLCLFITEHDAMKAYWGVEL
jgi:hypothetical protein